MKLESRDHDWVRARLAQWGKWNMAQGIGYPSIAAHESLRLGTSVFDDAAMPDDLRAVDRAVWHLTPGLKCVVVEVYTHRGSHEDHMIRLRLPKWAYYRRKNTAEQKVYCLLQSATEFPTFVAA
jgi:hypothetical protein